MDVRQLIRLLETSSKFNPETFCQSLKTAYADVQRTTARKDTIRQVASLAEVARIRSRFLPLQERRAFLAEVDAILGITDHE